MIKELINNTELEKMTLDSLSKLKNINKKFQPYIKTNEINKEITLGWELFEGFKNISEQELFINYLDDITKADTILYDLAKYCESNGITYSLKIVKYNKLLDDPKSPKLITSFIAFNFPETDYYKNNVNDTIPKTEAEFELRKEFKK